MGVRLFTNEIYNMSWRSWHLSSGLRVVSIRHPGSQLVAIKICIRAGSRYDHEISGLSHLLEHLLLTGTQHRSSFEIYSTIDAIGGDINAQIGKEYMSFHCVIPVSHWLLGLDLLADILIYPSLEEQALMREKLVVIQEIRDFKDQYQQLYTLFAETLWQMHPLRRSILGDPNQVVEADREILIQSYKQHFRSGNIVVAVCSDLCHSQVLDQVLAKLATLPCGDECTPISVVEPPLTQPRLSRLTCNANQVYMMIGVPTIGMKHPDQNPLRVIERTLGMGMGARLYRRLREELGLVYSVKTTLTNYEDTGYLAISATSQPKNVAKVHEVVLEELSKLYQYGITADELRAAQGNYVGLLARRFETNLSIASVAAKDALLNQIEPFQVSIARIKAVTLDEVMCAANQYLRAQSYVMATVGADWRGLGSDPSSRENAQINLNADASNQNSFL
jgi:predicted Zn-dependent peptidase